MPQKGAAAVAEGSEEEEEEDIDFDDDFEGDLLCAKYLFNLHLMPNLITYLYYNLIESQLIHDKFSSKIVFSWRLQMKKTCLSTILRRVLKNQPRDPESEFKDWFMNTKLPLCLK